jgi:hypothetical protein
MSADTMQELRGRTVVVTGGVPGSARVTRFSARVTVPDQPVASSIRP